MQHSECVGAGRRRVGWLGEKNRCRHAATTTPPPPTHSWTTSCPQTHCPPRPPSTAPPSWSAGGEAPGAASALQPSSSWWWWWWWWWRARRSCWGRSRRLLWPAQRWRRGGTWSRRGGGGRCPAPMPRQRAATSLRLCPRDGAGAVGVSSPPDSQVRVQRGGRRAAERESERMDWRDCCFPPVSHPHHHRFREKKGGSVHHHTRRNKKGPPQHH